MFCALHFLVKFEGKYAVIIFSAKISKAGKRQESKAGITISIE
jgi:hypothetical protein